MPTKAQVTLTGNESKRLIAKAALTYPKIQSCIHDGNKLLLVGGTTVSALSEEMGFGPMRISGRIEASGTRTALRMTDASHNLLVRNGEAVNADADIQSVVNDMGPSDLIVVGANAIDSQGRAVLAFATAGGGRRGYALHNAFIRGISMVILCGLNKLVPDLGAAMANGGMSDVEMSMGAAIELYNIYGSIITEIKAFEMLYNVQAVTIAGSGIGSGEGSRTFVLLGEHDNVLRAWKGVAALKGAALSGAPESMITCVGGCASCIRHTGCVYKYNAENGLPQYPNDCI